MSTVTLNTSEGTEYRVAHAEPSAVVRVKSGDLVVIAAWFGLITGLAEVLVLAFKKFVLHQFINAGPTVVWMAPLADAILFTMVGLSLFLVARFRRKLLPLGVIIFVFAFFQCLSLLLMYPRLHYFANFLLAAGVAVQATRFTVTRSEAFLRLVRHSTGWVLAGLVAVAVSLHAWQIISERRAVASLPAAPIGSPNVLLIVLDTVRAQSMSLYGYSRPTTPELERLARKGILFEHAISTAPWTLPSHASMFTGRVIHEMSVFLM
jgi:hypothetical protein